MPLSWISVRPAVALCLCVAFGPGCTPTKTTAPGPQTPALGAVHDDPTFESRLRIFDAQGNERTLPSVLDELAEADVVFFGETHTDALTHALEHAVLTGIASRRDNAVTVSMEMFQRDAQPVVDQYLAAKVDEAALHERANPWPNYRTGYRALVETAKEIGAPVVAANTPRSALRLVGGRGKEAYDKVRADQPGALPEAMHPPSEAYQRRVGRAMRGHGPTAGAKGDATWSVQNYWDNTMAESVANARAQHDDRSVIHYAGGFHIAEHDGTVAQFTKRRPDDTVKTIMAVPTFDLATAAADAKLADFVAYVRADARGPDSGRLAVAVPGALSWRYALPKTRDPSDTHPLVVVLPDHNERPADTLRRWQALLSDRAIVAVIEPPYRQVSELGWIERRWSFPATFSGDISVLGVGLPRIIAYAKQYLPVAEGPATVVGEGMGGAGVLWSALYGDDLDAAVVAIAPTLPHALAKASIPDAASAVRSVTVVYEGSPASELDAVTAALADVGVTTERVQLAIDTPSLARDRSAVVAKLVGAPAPKLSADAPHVLVVGGLAAHGRAWADGMAARWEQAGLATIVAQSSQSPRALVLGTGSPEASRWVATVLRGSPLPRPVASFGGGTIIVIPRGMPERVRTAWQATVEASKEQRGRFSPIHLVTEGSGKLRDAALQIREAGWSDVVVVPAVFAAHAALMKRLRDGATDLPEDLTVQWLPGLGGQVLRYADSPEPAASNP